MLGRSKKPPRRRSRPSGSPPEGGSSDPLRVAGAEPSPPERDLGHSSPEDEWRPSVGANGPPNEIEPLPHPRLDVLEIGRDPVRRAEPKLDGTTSPYRPDTIVDGGTAFGLTLRAASVRGRTKRFEGEAREDDFCLLTDSINGVVVVAVADGLGAATRSSLGSALAVRHAVAAVEDQLAAGNALSIDWSTVFNRAASALVVEHRGQRNGEEGRQRPDYDETRAVSKDLGTTLTVVIVRRESSGVTSISAAAIGDSPVFRLANGEYELLVGRRVTDEAFSTSAVVALPYLPVPETVECQLEQDEILLICTDGFSEPLSEGNSDVGRFFARELADPPPIASWAYLVDFEKATYDDDRTLVAIWPKRAHEDAGETSELEPTTTVVSVPEKGIAIPPSQGDSDD